METAMQVIRKERELLAAKNAPVKRRAINPRGTAIAGWSLDENRWRMVAGQLEDGSWVGFEHEMFLNGRPLTEDWREV